MIATKNGISQGGWCTDIVGGTYGVSLWKYISKGCSKFATFVKYGVGTGDKIQFWYDRWWGDETFKDRYLKLFLIAQGGKGG